MKKLGRLIRVKFIYTDELLKKLLENHSEDFYKKMKDKFAEKEVIKFKPFDKPAFEKELLTFSNTFTFFSYEELVETLKDYKQFTFLSYYITDNNSDVFKRKEYGTCYALDVTGLIMEKCLEDYVYYEKQKYHIEKTKAGAKHLVKTVNYWGEKI